MPTKKQLIIAGVAGGVVIGGALFLLSRSKRQAGQEEGDDTEFTAPIAQATEGEITTQPTFTTEYSFAVTDANEMMIEAALAETERLKKRSQATAPLKMDDHVTFPTLGFRIKPLPGWTAAEELSPMPNVAMVAVTRPEFAEAQARVGGDMEAMTGIPLLVLSMEDISMENLNLAEFVEKSKQMAFGQMMMMTQGRCSPTMQFDGPLPVGPFQHCLEYSQQVPPYFDMKVCNLITVGDGVAYVFQLMCNPQVMSTYKEAFMTMARSVTLIPQTDDEKDFTKRAYIEIATKDITLRLRSSWQFSAGTGTSLLEINTCSSVKPETISVYRDGNGPVLSALTKGTEKTVSGALVTTYTDGKRERKTFRGNGIILYVQPQQKSQSYIDDHTLICVLKSVSAGGRVADGIQARFVNAVNGYSFAVPATGRIIATRVGGSTVAFAPDGIAADDLTEAGPAVTIRCGDSATDPDCSATLAEWEHRIRSETSGSVTNVGITTINGNQCLTFINKDMQEVGMGQRSEVQGKVFVFVRDGKTTLIRWETPTGLWRKNERKMEQMINSLQFI